MRRDDTGWSSRLGGALFAAWAFLVGAVAAGCLRDEAVAALDGGIAVEWWVRKELGGGGRGVGIREVETFEFSRPQKLVVTLDDKWRSRPWRRRGPQFAASPSGGEIAYRSGPDEAWRIAYVSRAAPRAFPHCRLMLGSADAPDWSRRVPFARAAPDLLQCLGLSRGLFDEMRATGGDRALADLLVAGRGSFVAAPGRVRPPPGTPFDNWEWALDSLPAAERARVVDVLRRDLANGGSTEGALTRALWGVDPIDGAVLVARARELAARSERGPLLVVLARLAEARNAEAGAVACAVLPGSVRQSWISAADAAALAVIAATKAPCPGVAALLTARPDQLEYNCGPSSDAHLCTDSELAPLVQAHVHGVATDRWFFVEHPALDGWRALLAAGYAQGALPPPIAEAGERRRLLAQGCFEYRDWLQFSRDEQQATSSSEQWNAARTNAEKAARCRERAKAERALGARAPELQHPTLRAIEVRRNACSLRRAIRFDEEAAAWEGGDPAAIAAAQDRQSAVYEECMQIETEASILCRGYRE